MSETTVLLEHGQAVDQVAAKHPGLVFVPAGNARLTRQCRKATEELVVVMQFPTPHYWGQRRHWAPKQVGLFVTPAALAEAQAAAPEPVAVDTGGISL